MTAIPSLQYALIEPDDVLRAYKPAEQIDPAYLAEVCVEVSADIERRIDRNIVSRTYTLETYDGTGTRYLRLNNYPVTTITASQRDGVAKAAADFNLSSLDDLIVDGDRGLLYYGGGWDERPLWYRDQGGGVAAPTRVDTTVTEFTGSVATDGIWAFTYTAGYAKTNVLLADLKRVARELAVHAIREISMVGTANQTSGGYSEARWALGDQGMALRHRKILANWKRVRML